MKGLVVNTLERTEPLGFMNGEQLLRSFLQLHPAGIKFRQTFRLTLHPDELGPLGVAAVVEPVGEDQARVSSSGASRMAARNPCSSGIGNRFLCDANV